MTPKQLKDWNKARAEKEGVPVRMIERNYMLEQFLSRVASSDYKDNFVLKGGFLIGSMVGLSQRTTEDLDTTLKGMSLSEDTLKNMLEEIIKEPTKDGVIFELGSFKETREAAAYPGYQVRIVGKLENMKIPIKLDITTGDSIFPIEEKYRHKMMYSEETMEIYAYPKEQVLAEKLHSVITWGEDNSRLRDYYDIHMLKNLEGNAINYPTLAKSLNKTMQTRESNISPTSYLTKVNQLEGSESLNRYWERYQQTNAYANELSFDTVFSSAKTMIKAIDTINKQEIVRNRNNTFER